MSNLWNTEIRIPSGQKIHVQIQVRNDKGDIIDPKGLDGMVIIGQGSDKREDYRELKLGRKGDLLLIYFPPMSPGKYRIKLMLKKNKQLLHLQEIRVRVMGAYVINPSSRNFGGIDGY